MAAAVRPFMSTPDQGSISALWAGTSPELREEGKWKNGSYFTEARENGKESAEASDQEVSPFEFDGRSSLILLLLSAYRQFLRQLGENH